MRKLTMRVALIVMMLTGAALAQPGAGSAEAPAPTRSAAEARKICAEALTADPTFAKSIVETFTASKVDQEVLKAHEDANYHVQKNEKHVLYAYAAMWVVAALFVLFLWRRQQALKAEIAVLRHDLEAAGKEAK